MLPRPGLLSNSNSPSMAVTRRREMARPSPVPPKRRVVDASAWENGSNRRRAVGLGDADAGVDHLEADGHHLADFGLDPDPYDDLARRP